jgi:hypothetical protein
MTRPIHLLVLPTRASKINGTRSHWALFIPYTTDSSVGKLIQVLGTPFTGYGLEFKRNYNLALITEKLEKVFLGEMAEKWIQAEGDEAGDGKATTDVTPRDEIERLAKRIDVPGVSKEPLNPLVVCVIKGEHYEVSVADLIREGDVRSGLENLSRFSLGKEF